MTQPSTLRPVEPSADVLTHVERAETAAIAPDLSTDPHLPAEVGEAAIASAGGTTETQAETNAGVARASGVVALGNIASRVLGMARDLVLTNLFGASRAADAFFLATIIPKTLYDLLIAGHVNSAIVPVFSEIAARDGLAALWGVVSVLASLVGVLLSALTLLLVVFAPQLVSLVGSGYDAPMLSLAADLLRLTAPALLFLSLFAVFSGALYALRSFRYPALAGAAFNGAIVLAMLILTPGPVLHPTYLGGGQMAWVLERLPGGVASAAAGWLIGSLVQLALQLFGMKGARLRFTLNWRHPAVRQIALLYAPVMFSLALDTLIVRTVSYNLASNTGEGSLSYMNWATTLIQFPQGLVATAISIAILPTLARQAAGMTGAGAGENQKTATARERTAFMPPLQDTQPFRDTLGLGLRLTITLILPAALGLVALGRPLVELLFEHGAFTPADTLVTVTALRFYLIGLPFAAVDLLLVYAFYARQDTLTPALIGAVSLIVYLIVALLLIAPFGLFSLMIADSVKHIVHTALSAFILSRRLPGGFAGQRLPTTVIRAGAAALVMTAITRALMPSLGSLTSGLFGRTTWMELALVTLSAAISLAVFTAAAWLFRLQEWRWMLGMVRTRVLGR